jgi:outer membrane protein OmpA-like peptidoglycan-associated protein
MIESLRAVRRAGALVVLCVAFSALLAGCAGTSTVILLPEKDGRQTAVAVKQGDKEVVLGQPYAAARTTIGGPREYVGTAQEVANQFGPALAAQPARAATFTLYFIEGRDEFTEESQREVDRILSEIAKRPVPDVLVVGYTDTVGTDQSNDALGMQRAETVRAALMRLGIPPDDVRAISRGKRALAVPTADGVAEPLNRRVVIVVR